MALQKKNMVIKDGFVMEKVGPKRIVKSVTFGVLFVYRYRYKIGDLEYLSLSPENPC